MWMDGKLKALHQILSKKSKSDFVGAMYRKVHLLENPQLLNLDTGDKHYFAKAILTRTSESPATTTSTSLTIDSGSDSADETDHRLLV